METIRVYLDNIFANLPATEDVIRAKRELLAMMEDKYNELIAEGKTENEAVGIVFNEFGNLDEIVDSLDIDGEEEVIETVEAEVRRQVTSEEARDFIHEWALSKYTLGLGIAFCIVSAVGPIMGAGLSELIPIGIISRTSTAFGVLALFLSVLFGVILIIISSARLGEWRFLKEELCYIDDMTEDYVRRELTTAKNSKGVVLATGIILCSLCFLPTMMISIIFENAFMTEAIAPSMLFLMVGLGVLLIVASSGRAGACERLLKLNSIQKPGHAMERDDSVKSSGNSAAYIDAGAYTVKENYKMAGNKIKKKNNSGESDPLIETILGNYWMIVLILFFFGGFVLGAWKWIWIIWLIAPVVRTYLRKTYMK